ncbi:MAG: PAS domain S-box protein, partial [Spirochaetaceae bacterium]
MGQQGSRTILLVEDEALIAMAEKMILERAGYSVVTAGTGERALEIVGNGHHSDQGAPGDRTVDLILMDIDLGPGMRGTEAAALILAERELPVVFLSSHTEREVVAETEGITSYGYIVKNSGETVLLASIKMAFRLFETRRIVGDTFTHSINGMCVHRVIRDDSGKLLDCEYLQLNGAFEQQTGLSARAITGKTIRDLYPGSEADQVIHLYEEILAGRADSRQELYFEPTQFWFELSVFPIRDDEFTVVVHNITERKHSERRMQDLFEHMNEAFAVHEVIRDGSGRAVDYRFVEVNRGFATRLGMAPEDILGHTALELFPGTELSWIDAFGRVAATGMPEQITEYSRELDRHFETRLYRPREGYCAGIFMDVTARVQAEQKTARHLQDLNEINRIGTLANRELDLDSVLTFILEQTTRAVNAQVGMIFLHDPETETLSWGASLGLSEEFIQEYQRTPIRMGEGLTGTIARTREPIFIPLDSSRDPRVSRSVIHREDLNSFIGVPILAGDQVVGVMNVLTTPPEHLSPEDVPFCLAIGVQAGWAIVNARLQAEATETDRRFRTISDNAVYGNAIADLQGNLVYVNTFFARVHGYEPEELSGRHLSVFHTPRQMETVGRMLSSLIAEGSFSPVETWHVRRDGTEFPMLMSGVVIRDEMGEPRYIAASAIDMTESKETVRRLSTIMSAVPVGIVVFDQSAEVIEDNPAARRIFRLDAGAHHHTDAHTEALATGSPLCGDYIRCGHCAAETSGCGDTPHCRDCTINDAIREVLHGGDGVEEQDQEVVQDSGRSLWIRFGVVPLELPGARCALLVAQDISPRKRAEQEISRQLAEKELLLREVHHRV